MVQGKNRGGGGGTRGQPNYIEQAINERYRPGPEPREGKSVWPSWGQILHQGEQANTAANREEARLAVLRADGQKAMEAVSKLAQQRREAAQGIGVVTLPNNVPANKASNQTFNLSASVQKGSSGGWFDQRAETQDHRASAIHQQRFALPIPKPQTMANRLAALQRIIAPSTRQRQRDALSIYAKPLTALAMHSANRFHGSVTASGFNPNPFGENKLPLPESNQALLKGF